jgi:competence protein ComEC
VGEGLQLMLHWSASGDAFVRSAAGGMQRFEFADGDGLSPLRYSALEAAEYGELPCELSTPAGVITIGAEGTCRLQGDEAIQLSLADVAETCTSTHDWRSVKAAGGLSVWKDKSSLVVQAGAVCRDRPWRHCQS